MSKVYRACSIAAFLLPSIARAQSSVDPLNKFSWAENCGYINWFDAGSPAGAQGVAIAITNSHLSGFAWSENTGWINFGDGSPTSGTNYANLNGTDFGVNIESGSANLSGFAWSENAGWINFSGGALATPANAARIDFAAGRLRGYAWGENIGWINLDDPTKYVGVIIANPPCDTIDFNGNGVFPEDQDVVDFFDVLAGAPCPTGTCNDIDFNNNGVFPEDQDVVDFFNVLAGGSCP